MTYARASTAPVAATTASVGQVLLDVRCRCAWCGRDERVTPEHDIRCPLGLLLDGALEMGRD